MGNLRSKVEKKLYSIPQSKTDDRAEQLARIIVMLADEIDNLKSEISGLSNAVQSLRSKGDYCN